jgi:hypothetical protein
VAFYHIYRYATHTNPTTTAPIPTAIEINLPRPQVLPAVPVSLDVGVASTIPEETELIHVTVVVTAELGSAVLVLTVLVTALDFFVPDCAVPGFVEVEFGVNTAFEPSNQPMFAITAWLSRTVTETLPFDPIGMAVMVELMVSGVPSLLNS